MRFRLRTLLILLALAPLAIAVGYWANQSRKVVPPPEFPPPPRIAEPSYEEGEQT